MRISYIEVCGFRSYGAEPQRVELLSPLAVIHADNSQGKTSFAEAFEFLYTGTISRRQLGGGSPGEFQGALRNAHLGPTIDVYVEVGLIDADGTEYAIRRQLDLDYQGATDCASTLTVNGVETETVTGVGLHLSDPPLAAPVLLEHALRYAVSAKPGDRSDYFKAVLEVADLDVVRAEIAALIAEREGRPRELVLQELDSLTSNPALLPTLTVSRASEQRHLDSSFLATLNAVVPPAPDEMPGEEPLVTAVKRVQIELASRQNNVVPVHQFRPDRVPQPGIRVDVAMTTDHAEVGSEGASLSGRLASYNALAATVERSVADLLPLLRVALSVNVLAQHSSEDPVDCPLCETSGALTPERLVVIRQQVADQEGFTKSGSSVRAAVMSLSVDLDAIKGWSAKTSPGAASWTDEQRVVRGGAVLQLGGSAELFRAAVQNADLVRSGAAGITELVDKALLVLRRIVEDLDQLLEVSPTVIAELIQYDGAIREALRVHASVVANADLAAEACIEGSSPGTWCMTSSCDSSR